MKDKAEILVVDDEVYVREYFRKILCEDSRVSFAATGGEALSFWKENDYDLIIMDIRLPDISGFDVLRRIREGDPDTMVIIISAYGDIDSVIDAMKLGANDFFTKPFTGVDKIRIDITNCLKTRRLIRENHQLQDQVRDSAPGEMIYASSAMQRIISMATRSACFDSPVLIQGESGAGKELVARHIHNSSPRHQGTFLAVNCGALPESLLEPTLFGHEKGAFTGANRTAPGYFEAADGGTIFLDEIGETSSSFQTRLLRVLQEGELMRVGGSRVIKVNARLISATNRDLKSLVSKGLFRKDLFYRINVINLQVPPLRERPEDIPVLIEQFAQRFCERNSLSPRKFSKEVIAYMQNLTWEGNVRELQNLVERTMVFCPNQTVTLDDLPKELHQSARTCAAWNYKEARDSFERNYIGQLLNHCDHDLKEAVRLSSLDLATIYRKRSRYTSS